MKPRILLVEDDPVSREFLAVAAEGLPAIVDAVATCAEAMRGVLERPGHGVWLIDANLPDGDGRELLANLRAVSGDTPALAHTASRDRAQLDDLIDAGFAEVLVKPLAAGALQAALRRALGRPADAIAEVRPGWKLPSWDDAAALSSLKGEATHVAALRLLFLDELPGQQREIGAALAQGDAVRARNVLHRLRASCGFVGAARLGEAVRELEADPGSAHALQRFDEAAGDLLVPV